jgi:hypothetical protein
LFQIEGARVAWPKGRRSFRAIVGFQRIHAAWRAIDVRASSP